MNSVDSSGLCFTRVAALSDGDWLTAATQTLTSLYLKHLYQLFISHVVLCDISFVFPVPTASLYLYSWNRHLQACYDKLSLPRFKLSLNPPSSTPRCSFLLSFLIELKAFTCSIFHGYIQEPLHWAGARPWRWKMRWVLGQLVILFPISISCKCYFPSWYLTNIHCIHHRAEKCLCIYKAEPSSFLLAFHTACWNAVSGQSHAPSLISALSLSNTRNPLLTHITWRDKLTYILPRLNQTHRRR